MPGRTFNTTGTEFGFNGKRKDNEISGESDAYDFGERMYDPRLGRFTSMDKLAQKFPEYTPYISSANCPIKIVDFDGNYIIVKGTSNDVKTFVYFLRKTTGLDIEIGRSGKLELVGMGSEKDVSPEYRNFVTYLLGKDSPEIPINLISEGNDYEGSSSSDTYIDDVDNAAFNIDNLKQTEIGRAS